MDTNFGHRVRVCADGGCGVAVRWPPPDALASGRRSRRAAHRGLSVLVYRVSRPPPRCLRPRTCLSPIAAKFIHLSASHCGHRPPRAETPPAERPSRGMLASARRHTRPARNRSIASRALTAASPLSIYRLITAPRAVPPPARSPRGMPVTPLRRTDTHARAGACGQRRGWRTGTGREKGKVSDFLGGGLAGAVSRAAAGSVWHPHVRG